MSATHIPMASHASISRSGAQALGTGQLVRTWLVGISAYYRPSLLDISEPGIIQNVSAATYFLVQTPAPALTTARVPSRKTMGCTGPWKYPFRTITRQQHARPVLRTTAPPPGTRNPAPTQNAFIHDHVCSTP